MYKKSLIQMLGKLYLPDEVDDDKIRVLKLLVNNLRTVSMPSFSVVALLNMHGCSAVLNVIPPQGTR